METYYIKFISGIAIVILLLYLLSYTISSQKERIVEWSEDNGYSASNIEICTFNKGPYWWAGRNTYVYSADLQDSRRVRKSYFYFGLFGMEQQFVEE